MTFKNSLLSIVLAGISIVSGCKTTPTQEYLARTVRPNPSRWEQLNVNPPKNEREIRDYLRSNITYGIEREEGWMSPKVCATRGYGDCDDTGILGAYLAGKLEYPMKIIAIREVRGLEFCGGHVMTFLEKKENEKTKYGLIGLGVLALPVFDSVEELIQVLNENNKKDGNGRRWNCYKIIDLDSCFPKDWTTTGKNLFNENEMLKDYNSVE